MSGEKSATPCNKFQANIFNKSKCQNCFKSRELHLLGDRDMEQAKPVYGGWLCLAPEGTDFNNPMQRSRKWQRRFFILYEHGSLSFALDELPSTLPQGTLNMNLCTDITDAEPRTGQRNALCIVTPEQEIFIRGENKEIINGWSEQLSVYLRTNKQNMKKKRKVEPVGIQEPSPAKMAATDPSCPSMERAAEPWQEEQAGRGVQESPIWTGADPDPLGPEQTPAGVTRPHLSTDESLESLTNGTSAESDNIQDGSRRVDEPAERRRGAEPEEGSAVSRTGRSEARAAPREKLQSCGDVTQLSVPLHPPERRSRSLDRRTSDTVMTPDLLNFKKGWMVLLDDGGQWKKYWFVLSTDRLRYYKDSIAEEASDLEGELDLSKCYNVSEYQVQRNYGFQIHTSTDVYTLSAMTSGIRKNWIQALMKNVHPANAPGVASLPTLHLSCSAPEVLPKPDLTQDSRSTSASAEPKPRSVLERRREGRNKTFDWAELLPLKSSDSDSDTGKVLCSLELSDRERRKRREERRRRYETMLGFSLAWEVAGDPLKSKKQLEGEIELYWKQVETTLFKLERTVPLHGTKHPTELEKLLDDYRTKVEDLKVQLMDSERRRLEVEALLSQQGFCEQQQPCICPQCPEPDSSLEDNIKVEHETPSIWLQDTDGNFQELRELLDDWAEADVPVSPASSHGEEQTEDLNLQIEEDQSLLILEKPNEDDCPDQTVLHRLAQEVELLTDQNEALNQRNQEMLNQLTEADREIERLKAELNGRYGEAHHHPDAEKLESLEKELSLRDQQLLDAQALVATLEGSLKDTEALLRESDQPEKSVQKSEGYLLRCFEATEAKLTELERKLSQSELTCRELQEQNAELKEAEKVFSERRSESRRLAEEESRSGEERTQEVMEGLLMRSRVLDELLGGMDRLGLGVDERATEGGVVRQLRWEEEVWSSLFGEVKTSAVGEETEKLLSDITEQKMVEARMMLLGHNLLSGEDLLNGEDTTHLKAVADVKTSFLNKVATSVSEHEDLRLMAERLLHLSQRPCSALLDSAATEALLSCRVSRLQAEHQLELQETKDRLLASFICCNCGMLQEQNQQLTDQLRNLEETLKQTKQMWIDRVTTGSQTEGCDQPEVGEEAELGLMEVSEGNSAQEERVLQLTRDVDVLQQRLSIIEEQLTTQWEEKMRLALEQHDKEMEKLKATCESALTSLDDSHLKLVEELRRRHQQELERLLLERDKLLEEETAATATAIEAIQSAHRLELQKEVQRRQQSESSTGDALLEEVYRRHSEELASCQRELEVLSQQYSLKCLENSHLGQALDAERKALCQCQQENQDLRTRNQELSSHLAAEITRLCSLAKQEDPALAQRTDVYQMEITLRVKESEVQCLKQELTSLKDDLQAAQKERRSAAKMYTDTYGELSVVRARAERDMEELRERLRLANQALTSP